MKRFLLFLTVLGAFSSLWAQDLFPGRGAAFQDDIIPRVDIVIPIASLDQILAPGNEQSNEEHEATFYFTDADGVDTVQQIGFRLRGNTSRTSAKKSFKVSFNTFLDQKWKGLEKMNLNGEHNDPTVSRAKIAWDLLRDIGVPGARANHVELYINGDYRGLYANVEHIDEEFVERRFGNKDGNLYKCLYPADLAYLGENPEAYKLAPFGRRAYELQTNEDADDYSDLANFISVLNQTAIDQLPCELEAVFNVDSYLRTMAFDVLTGNWDGYAFNQNNFYLYHNTATDRFEYIPFDLDNTLGIDWLGQDWTERNLYNWPGSGDDRPLFERLLSVPDYRARYTFYLEQFLEETFNAANLYAELDALQSRLLPFVSDDPFYSLDYGFSIADFEAAFDGNTGYDHTAYGLKSFISARRSSAYQQMEDLNPAPHLFDARANIATVGQELAFQVKVQEDQQLAEVLLCYQAEGEEAACINMYDDGHFGDGQASDGTYGVFVPAFNETTNVDWYLTATDNEGLSKRHPVCGHFTTAIGAGGLGLAINEFMASNDMTIADEFGEYDDWVELYNYSSASIDLNGRYLSDNPDNATKWAFPDISIAAGEFLLIWVDNDPEQGPLHTDFKLDAAGEFIGVFDTDAAGNALIDGTAFGPQMSDMALGRLPNGTGAFQDVSPTPGASNEPVGVREGFAFKPFEVYPNPARDFVQLRAPEEGHYEAWIIDGLGRRLDHHAWTGQETSWQLNLPAGMYFLLVEEEGKAVFSTKVAKL